MKTHRPGAMPAGRGEIPAQHARLPAVWPDTDPDDSLVFTKPVMGMFYDDFDRLLTETLSASAQTAPQAGLGAARQRLRRCAPGVRRFLSPDEGSGYSDFFKVSDTLCVSVTDAHYLRDTWIGIATPNMLKLRLVISGKLLTESRDVLVKASEALLDISPGNSRTGFYIAADERVRLICLHCRPEYLTEVMGLSPTELPPPLNKLFMRGQAVERLKVVAGAKVMQAVRMVADCRREMVPALRGTYLESLSMQILVHILSEFTAPRRPAAKTSLRMRDVHRIQAAREHLMKHFVKPPTISELARLVGVNQTKLKSAFREMSGMSIYEFILRCRMERAASLLASGDYDVAEVAFAVGYTYPANFTHAFKKFHGTLPRALANEGRARPSF